MISSTYVIGLAEAAAAANNDVGGKARGIAALIAAGAQVPPGFCVRGAALRDLLAQWRTTSGPAGEGSAASQHERAALRQACASAALPPGLETEVIRALAETWPTGSAEGRLMVRSSAPLEDNADARAPGVYRSVQVPARPAAVIAAIRTVWASAVSENAVRYKQHLGAPPADTDMAVVVQGYVEARLGGAIYTIDPVTKDPTRVVVSWVDGHPGGLLAGVQVGRTAAFNKSGDAAPTGDFPDAVKLAATEARRLERWLDKPLDLEFVVDERSVLHFVQCRPLAYEPAWRRRRTTLVGPAHEEYTLRSPKVVAVGLNCAAGGDLTDQIVIRPPLFEAFRQEGALPAEMITVLTDALTPLLQQGEVALRPAYWSALNSADNMPQSGHLRTLHECLDHLRRLWTYVIDQRLDDYSAEVAVLGGNWLRGVASALVAAEPQGTQVNVDAVPGYPEGLESHSYQTSIVDLAVERVLARRMPVGDMTALSPHDDVPSSVTVRADMPVLTDAECVRAARIGRNLARRLDSPVRVEFMVVLHDGRRAMTVWQVERRRVDTPVAAFRLSVGVAHGRRNIAAGVAVQIHSVEDLAKLADADHAHCIVLLDISAMRARDRVQQALIGEQAARLSCPVVVRSSPLSHFSALLRDYGAVVYAVREFPPGLVPGVAVTVLPDTQEESDPCLDRRDR